MLEVVFALLMTLNGDIVEHTYKEKLSQCMKSKRIAEKEVNPERVRFSCKQVEAKSENYMGAKKILKIISIVR